MAPLGGEAFVWQVTATFVPLLLGAAWAWWQSRTGRIAQATGGLAAGMSVLMLAAAFVVLPRFDAVKSARPMSRVLLQHMKPGESYGGARRRPRPA